MKKNSEGERGTTFKSANVFIAFESKTGVKLVTKVKFGC